MAPKHQRPGSPKGQPKPTKRVLDLDFPDRLREVMLDRWPGEWGEQVSLLADELDCTRAVVLNYLKTGKRSGEPLLILAMADALKVAHRWLLTGIGSKHERKSLTPAQEQLLASAAKIVDEAAARTPINTGTRHQAEPHGRPN